MIAENPEVTNKSFAFATKNELPIHYVSGRYLNVQLHVNNGFLRIQGKSENKENELLTFLSTASDGTNVVKMFNEAVKAATEYKKNPVDIEDQILEELEQM